MRYRGQGLGDLLQFDAHRARHGAAVRAHQHQRRTHHRFMAIALAAPSAQFAADFHLGDLPTVIGTPAARGDHRTGDLVERMDTRIGAHQIGLARALDVIRAHRDIGLFQRIGQIVIGNAESRHLGRIGLDQIFLHIAAQRIHIRHARHGAQLGRTIQSCTVRR
jgi:hypothetical protein